MDAEQQSPVVVKTSAEFPKGPPQPVYFLSLEVENVRCFKDPQTLNLADEKGRPKRWTVLLGNNGVGKTTLLQLLALSRPSEIPIHRELPVFGHGYDEFVLPRLLMAWYFMDWPPRDLAVWLRTKAPFMRCIAKYCYDVKLSDSNRIPRNFTIPVTLREDGASCDGASFPDNAKAFLCLGYGVGRRMSQRALTVSRSEDACETLFDESEPLLNAEEWLLQADYAAVKSNSDAAKIRYEKIKNILKEVLPDVEDLRIRPGDASLKAPAVEAKTPYGWVMLRNLSSGYRSVVAWTVDLASRLFEAYPDSPNPLAEAAVVLVDQIDLYMHPKWQVDLIQRLVNLFPNAQFITTAHSPLIVQAVEDANIVVLRRERDHVIIENNPEKVRGWRVDQILTSDIFGLSTTRDPATEKLLQERRALLAKATLSEADQERLKELNKAVAGIPFVESPQDVEAMELIRKAADELRHTAALK